MTVLSITYSGQVEKWIRTTEKKAEENKTVTGTEGTHGRMKDAKEDPS